MYFSSAMSALKKAQEQDEDSEEEDVFQQSREVVAAKTFSIETAVRYVYGQGFGMDVKILTEEEKEAIERARYCRKQLLRLKARRAAQEAGEADTSQILQQEEIEEWLANIELRLRQQSRHLGIPASEFPIWIAPLIKSRKAGRRDLPNIASAATAAAAAIRLKLTSGELTSGRGSPSIGASPADEQAAAIAALTDLMEELEELGNQTARSAAENKGDSTGQKGPKRTVRFQTPRSSPFQTPHMSPFSTPRSHPSEVNSLHRAALRLKKGNLNDGKPPPQGAETPPERSGTPEDSHQRAVRLKKTDSDEHNKSSSSGSQTPPERSGTPVDHVSHNRVAQLRKTDSDDVKPPHGAQTPPERSGTPTENAGHNRVVRLRKTDSESSKTPERAQTPERGPTPVENSKNSVRLRKTDSDEAKAQQVVQVSSKPATHPQRPKKTKVSALIESDGLRPHSGSGRHETRPGSSTTAVVKNKTTSSTKTYVSRRRGSENSSLTESLTRQFSPS